MPKLAIQPSTRGFSSIDKRGFQHVLYGKISKKKLTFFLARQFQTTSKQKCSNLRPLLSTPFPQGFRISTNFLYPTLKRGGKKTFKRYLKSEQTEKHTNRQTHRRTFRLRESIGPEGRCLKNGNLLKRKPFIVLKTKPFSSCKKSNFLAFPQTHLTLRKDICVQ